MTITLVPNGSPVMLGTAECHASTLASFSEGSYLCAWFGGTKEGDNDTAIWYCDRRNGVWQTPKILANVSPEPHWNPVLFATANQIYLYFKVGASPKVWRTYWMQTPENSPDWSQPAELIPGDIGGRGPVKNKPIILSNDDWLAPASIETQQAWYCFVDRWSNQGLSWHRSDLISPLKKNFRGKGIIQPSLWQSQPKKVHLLCRSTSNKIFRADSEDNGQTWSSAYPTNLPNNNSGIDLVQLDNGLLILAYNPIAKNWGNRTPLILAASQDNGFTWDKVFVLEDGAGEYSYPAIIATENGLAVTYTWRRESICFREFIVS